MSKNAVHATHVQQEIEYRVLSPYDKIRLVIRYWPLPKIDKPPIAILFVHGSGEHSQRYRHVAHFFNKSGIPCVGFDIRGHGLSGGERGFAPHINALLADLECVIKYIRDDLEIKVPLLIYAHGTGCSNVLGHVLRRPNKPLDCAGMILSTPSICLKIRPTPIIFFVTRAFANLSPHLRLPVSGNYTNEYTNDPLVVKEYREDPLVHDRWPARTLSLYFEIGYLLETTTLQFSVPVLVQHGVGDVITPAPGVRNWAENRVKALGGDLIYKEWDLASHELHNDLRKEEVLNYALDWIKNRFPIVETK